MGEEEGQEEDEDVGTQMIKEDEEQEEDADEEAVEDSGASIVLCSRKGLIKRTKVPAWRLLRVGLTVRTSVGRCWAASVSASRDVWRHP